MVNINDKVNIALIRGKSIKVGGRRQTQSFSLVGPRSVLGKDSLKKLSREQGLTLRKEFNLKQNVDSIAKLDVGFKGEIPIKKFLSFR